MRMRGTAVGGDGGLKTEGEKERSKRKKWGTREGLNADILQFSAPKIYHFSLSLSLPPSLSVVWQYALAVLGERGFACKSLSFYVIAICSVPGRHL